MANLQGQVGPVTGSDGSNPNFRQGRTSELNTADAHGRYNELVARGNAYSLTVAAGAVSAFAGGAGGTPLISIFNPPGSGKNLSVLFASVSVHASASGAGIVSFSLWGGVSVANTGTLTSPTNLLTLQTGGSVAKGSSNAATTSTTAISGNGPLFNVGSYYWATAAAATLGPLFADIGGAIVCAPGNLVAFGGSAALTSATYDASLIWEELPQ